jgi:uncharacterized membrane protein YheB (UPF0754 family)
MCFFPIYFRGWRPFGIAVGWQGIVPSKAERMADKACDLIIDRLIYVDKIVDMIDGGELFRYLSGLGITRRIENGVHDRSRRNILSRAPTKISNYILSRSAGLDDSVCVRFVSELKRLLKDREFFDVRDLIVSEFTTNKRLLVHLFTRVGAKELEFIEIAGCVMGLLCGLGQLAVYKLCDSGTSPWILFSVTGLLIGFATNWLALFVIFNPLEPIHFPSKSSKFRITIHALFMKRQLEVAAVYSRIVTETVLNVEKVVDHLKKSDRWSRVLLLFEQVLEDEIRKSIKFPFLSATQEQALVAALVAESTAELAQHAHIVAREIPAFIEMSIQLQNVLETKLGALSPAEFDGILHPVFQEDESTLIALGGLLGALVGLIQVNLFSL